MKAVIVAGLLAAVLLNAGCSQFDNEALAPVTEEMKQPVYPKARATVSSGDVIDIRFLRHPEMNTHVFVEHDGTIFMPLMGNIMVAGKSTREIHAELMEFYSKELRNLDIVISTEKPDAMVFAAGEVKASGVIPFRTNMTVSQVIAAAAPDLVKGDLKKTILIRKNIDCPEDGDYVAYLVNADFAAGEAHNIFVSPGDVVIVPRKGIALAGDAVQMYVRDLIPPSTSVNYGFFHEVRRISTGNGIIY